MIDDRGGSAASGLDRPAHGAEPDVLERQSLIQGPPHLLKDLEEIARHPGRARHPARQGRVEMMMRTAQARDDQAAGAIHSHGPRCLAADAAVRDHEVGLLDHARETAGDGGARQKEAQRRAARGGAARAAAESFIGRRVRHDPSNSCSAPATAPAVGTRPISPTPLAP